MTSPTSAISEAAVLAEWRAAMEGVTPGEWSHRPDMDCEHYRGLVLGGDGQDFGLVAEVTTPDDAGWVARCSPAGVGSLLALIDDLRARLAAAEGHEASLEKRRDYYRERMEAAEALATTATARVAELEGALKPFAREADEWHEDVPDDYRILCAEPGAETANHGAESVFTIGDLRRARALTGEPT